MSYFQIYLIKSNFKVYQWTYDINQKSKCFSQIWSAFYEDWIGQYCMSSARAVWIHNLYCWRADYRFMWIIFPGKGFQLNSFNWNSIEAKKLMKWTSSQNRFYALKKKFKLKWFHLTNGCFILWKLTETNKRKFSSSIFRGPRGTNHDDV